MRPYITWFLFPKTRDRARSPSAPFTPLSLYLYDHWPVRFKKAISWFIWFLWRITSYGQNPPFKLHLTFWDIFSFKKLLCNQTKGFGSHHLPSLRSSTITPRGFKISKTLLWTERYILNPPQRLGLQHEMRDKLLMNHQARPLPSSDFELHLYDHFHERKETRKLFGLSFPQWQQ